MTQIDDLTAALDSISEGEGNRETAQKLIDLGYIRLPDSPHGVRELFSSDLPPSQSEPIQTLVNFVIDAERRSKEATKNWSIGEVVEVQRDGNWVRGQISASDTWGLTVETERGPVTVQSDRRLRAVQS